MASDAVAHVTMNVQNGDALAWPSQPPGHLSDSVIARLWIASIIIDTAIARKYLAAIFDITSVSVISHNTYIVEITSGRGKTGHLNTLSAL